LKIVVPVHGLLFPQHHRERGGLSLEHSNVRGGLKVRSIGGMTVQAHKEDDIIPKITLSGTQGLVDGVVSKVLTQLEDGEPFDVLIACANVPRRSRITKLAVHPLHIEELGDLLSQSLILSRGEQFLRIYVVETAEGTDSVGLTAVLPFVGIVLRGGEVHKDTSVGEQVTDKADSIFSGG